MFPVSKVDDILFWTNDVFCWAHIIMLIVFSISLLRRQLGLTFFCCEKIKVSALSNKRGKERIEAQPPSNSEPICFWRKTFLERKTSSQKPLELLAFMPVNKTKVLIITNDREPQNFCLVHRSGRKRQSIKTNRYLADKEKLAKGCFELCWDTGNRKNYWKIKFEVTETNQILSTIDSFLLAYDEERLSGLECIGFICLLLVIFAAAAEIIIDHEWDKLIYMSLYSYIFGLFFKKKSLSDVLETLQTGILKVLIGLIRLRFRK